MVTPLAGVWVEIKSETKLPVPQIVTPLAGVWVEIYVGWYVLFDGCSSLPSRECGLKLR